MERRMIQSKNSDLFTALFRFSMQAGESLGPQDEGRMLRKVSDWKWLISAGNALLCPIGPSTGDSCM
jgi:hypothetical protein